MIERAAYNFANGLGLIILACVVYVSYRYINQIGFFILGIVGLVAAGGLFGLGWYLLEIILKKRAERREIEKRAAIEVVSHSGFVGIRDTSPHSGSWQIYTAPRLPSYPAGHPALPEPMPQQVDLLTALDSVQRGLIVGASNSGKTTLLQHIVARKQLASKVIVIDPHAYPGKWAGCMVIGAGRNYLEIEKALDALVRLMTKRYDEIGKGLVVEMGHNKVTIVIDEWRAIVYNVKGSGEAIAALLTESRKAAFTVFVGTHSERVKALGIEGEGDLKDGFGIVRLSNVNGIRRATLDIGNGEIQAVLPGPFVVQPARTVDADYMELDTEPDEEEAEVIKLRREGKSYREITMAVWGKYGKFYNDKVDAILKKYGEK